MKNLLFVSFILLSLNLNLLAQSQDLEKLPRKLLSQLVTMKTDSLPFLNTYEGECLDSVFSDCREGFDFTGKKVGFILSGEKQNKANYFNMYKGHIIDKKKPLDRGTLSIFNEVQKEESGGYDAAIIYWNKYLMPVKEIMQRLIFSIDKQRTVENILAHNFNISLTDFDYTIGSFKRYRKFIGDWQLRFVIKFKTLTQKDMAYFKKQCHGQLLPVSDTLYREVTPKYLSKRILRSKDGYYLYDYDAKRTIKLKIFIFDTEKKEAIFYMETN